MFFFKNVNLKNYLCLVLQKNLNYKQDLNI